MDKKVNVIMREKTKDGLITKHPQTNTKMVEGLQEALDGIIGEPYHIGYEPPEEDGMFWIDLNEWDPENSNSIFKRIDGLSSRVNEVSQKVDEQIETVAKGISAKVDKIDKEKVPLSSIMGNIPYPFVVNALIETGLTMDELEEKVFNGQLDFNDISLKSFEEVRETYGKLLPEERYRINHMMNEKLLIAEEKVEQLEQSKVDKDSVALSVNGKNGNVVLSGSDLMVSMSWSERIDDVLFDLYSDKADKSEIEEVKQSGVESNSILVDALNSKKVLASTEDTIRTNIAKVNDIVVGVEVFLKEVTNLIALQNQKTVELTWTSPEDVLCEGTPITKFKHDVLVRNSGKIPENINDGEQLVIGGRNEFKNSPFIDSNIEYDVTYYYRVFSVSENNLITNGSDVSILVRNVTLLQDLPVGSVIKSQGANIYNRPIEWMKLEDNHYGMNETTLISKEIITYKALDAQEPRNSSAIRRTSGNNRYKVSNLHQWLNSDKYDWYQDAHSSDQAPNKSHVYEGYNPYDNTPGFMNSWSGEFKDAILDTELEVAKTNADGGGKESFNAKIFCLSMAEMGLDNKGLSDGVPFAYFNSDDRRVTVASSDAKANTDSPNAYSVWRLRTPYITSPEYTYNVNYYGSNSVGNAYYSDIGVRPALNLPSSTEVNKKPNPDGSYNLLL